jgi:putative hemolysin
MDTDPALVARMSTPFILFVVALFVRAVFSFLETSITGLRLFKLKELARSTDRYKRLFQTLEKNPHRVLITTLIVSSCADVTAASLGTYVIEMVFESFNLSSGLGFSFGIGFATIAIIIFGEILPKSLAKGQGERMFGSMLWLINGVYYALYPLSRILMAFSDRVISLFGAGEPGEESAELVASEREIRFLIDYIHDKGLLESQKTEMLQNIFELGLTPVKEIMVPATEIISVELSTSLENTLRIFSRYNFTRLPVYDKKMDNVIGMVHLKDIFLLLSNNEQKPLKDLVRPIIFIPESVKINQLLQELRQQHMHMAIVLNEYGIITGLITLEDVLEQIVGDISDEHEPENAKITELQKGGWLVDASVSIEELSTHFKISFETQGSVTLAGFMTEQLQHLPKRGERLLYKGYYFQVHKASATRVQQVLVFEEEHVPVEKKEENGQ